MPDIIQIEKELDEIKQKNFWKLYIEAISKERESAIDHSIRDKERESVRIYQGKVQMIDDILFLPKRILKESKIRGSGNVP